MTDGHYLQTIVARQKKGEARGICSICSANQFVLEAALEFYRNKDEPVLLEATCNQVNQFGGYTGLKPADFQTFVGALAKQNGFPMERIIMGGDHLGPNPWKAEPAREAMAKAINLVRDYVQAGFTKIHLDASMHLADDRKDGFPLDPQLIAERTAELGKVAESAYAGSLGRGQKETVPVYIIGSEVPVPGGVTDDDGGLQVTTPEDFAQTVTLTKKAFEKSGLAEAWERVVGVVVQPGVEFGDQSIHEYDSLKARPLTERLKRYPNLVFEGHSTDYQQPHNLRKLVEDGVAILKVGPELTFALREALFALHHVEQELFSDNSRLAERVEKVMQEHPASWAPYYHGDAQELRLARRYSFSDRIRYYWSDPMVSAAVDTLLANLSSAPLPLSLISQYFPIQYEKVRAGQLEGRPMSLLKDHIAQVFGKYYWATRL